MKEEFDILLANYFSGEATEKELLELDSWLSKSKENENYFNQMTILYQKASLIPEIHENNFELDKAFEEFSNYIHKENKAPKRIILRSPAFLRTAAASIILIAATLSIYLIYNNSNKKHDSKEYFAANTPEILNITEDIEVILEPESKISYKHGKKNEIELSGKATFAISPENNEELLVHAGEVYIKDIGTVFTVTAHPENELTIVEVEEGEVLFYTENNPGISIKQNEKGEYNALTKKFSLSTAHSPVEEMPESNEIIFNGITLYEIADFLKKKSDINIIISSDSIKNLRINASFDPNEPIENILEIIGTTLSVNITQNDKTFIISE